MSMTSRKNLTVKALQSKLVKEMKFDAQAKTEYEISCATNPEKYRTYDQTEIHELYSRRDWDCKAGATKICHTKCHNGNDFHYIVVKRFLYHGSVIEGKNQLIEEIKCWKQYSDTPEADLLCPILKYFTSKSDHVKDTSEKMKHNVIIIAQKAVYVSNAENACRKAEELNREKGLAGESARTRFEKLRAMSDKNHWWDAMRNRGNSGVIFDYHQNCYKAVFIDYAL